MSRRKYANIKEVEPQIIVMREAGMTRQEIADELGLEKEQIKNWVSRYNRRGALKAKGRPRKDGQPPRQDIHKELERLRMENKLLRDFLQSVERM